MNDIMNQLEMKMDFHNITLTQTEESKMVNLIFEDANKVYRTCFPMEYPLGPPQIFESSDENTCNPIEAVLEWKNEGSLVTTTVDYINTTIQILNKKRTA